MNGASALTLGLLFAGGALAGTAPARGLAHLPYDRPWPAARPCLIGLARCSEWFPVPQPCLVDTAQCRREFSVEPAQIVPARGRSAEKPRR
ncbi:MAG: hypothetical protein QJR02_11855 [Sinobacteraceae bacterium]|nr:hypothetical protein [Nevskia sp.]MDI3260380.1 hypothetical protein [Nevskiaceae bacterium]